MNTLPVSPNQVTEFLSRTQTTTLLGGIVFPHVYGSFSSSQPQPIAQAPNRTALTYNTTDMAGGGLILKGVYPSAEILFSTSGTYRVITSVQLNKKTGGSGDVYIWFARNGASIPNSATKTYVNNNLETVMTVEILTPVFAGETISIEANASTNDMEAHAEPPVSPVPPAVPSIITIVQRIA